LGLAVLCQFCYVGGQEVNGTDAATYLATIAPSFDASNFMAIAHTAFAVARFCAAGLGFWIKPRHLLAFFLAGAIVFSSLSVHLTGDAAVACNIMVYFMEGPIFSLVFAQGLHGMGRHTRLASVLLTSAISGGAVFSPISNAITQSPSGGAPYALVVAIAVFAAGVVFPLALIFVPRLRTLVEYPAESRGPPSSRPSSMSSRAGRRVMSFIDLGKKKGRESQTVEHRERQASDAL